MPTSPLGYAQVTEGPAPGGAPTAMVLLANVTAPVRANALPFSAAPVVTVTDAWAMIVPLKVVLVPRVAELPTCQKTLEATAPPMSATALLPAAVVSVLPIWKMKTAFGSPLPLRVTVPVMPTEVALQ